jgi:hypothetical protein
VKRLLAAWWAKYAQTPTPVSELYAIASGSAVLFPLGGKDDHGRRISLGRRLRELVGRPYEIAPGVTVSIAGESSDSHTKVALWELREMREVAEVEGRPYAHARREITGG